MQLAIVAAGFTPGEADQLRRSMAAWKRRGGLGHFERRLIEGMRARGYDDSFAHQIFSQIQGFGEYGFPESHAASFALLVYSSAWLKCYEPAAFTCALLNSQPMGFYAPAQLVRDARGHGVEVRPVNVCVGGWDSTLERRVPDDEPALRLGLRMVKGLGKEAAMRIEAARVAAPFASVQDLTLRAALERRELEALADAGALRGLSGNRHLTFWQVAGTEQELPLAPVPRAPEGTPLLAPPTEGQNIAADYRSHGLTLGRHPLALMREELAAAHIVTAAQLAELPHGRVVRVAGIVTARQRPQSAGGVMFVTLEDETGYVNLILWETRVVTRAPHRQQLAAAGSAGTVAEGRAGDTRGGGPPGRSHAHAGHGRDPVPRFSLTLLLRVLGMVQPANSRGIVVDVVVVEIAGELCGVFVFESALETPPGGIAQLLAALLGGIEVFRESIEIDFAGRLEGNFFFVLVELFRFRFLVHNAATPDGRVIKREAASCNAPTPPKVTECNYSFQRWA